MVRKNSDRSTARTHADLSSPQPRTDFSRRNVSSMTDRYGTAVRHLAWAVAKARVERASYCVSPIPFSSSSTVYASMRPGVPKPSVNRP